MSLMSMRRKMASKRTSTYILWLLILVFAVTAVLWSMNPSKMKGAGNYTGPMKEVIATVNGTSIRAGELEDKYNPRGEKSGEKRHYYSSAIQERQTAFDALVEKIAREQAVDKMGIHVWPWTLSRFAKEYARFFLINMHDQAKQAADAEAKTPPAQRQNPNQKPRTADEVFKEQLGNMVKEVGITTTNPTEADFIRGFVDKAGTSGEEGYKDSLMGPMQAYLIGQKLIGQMSGPSPVSEDFVKKLYTTDVKGSLIFIAAKDKSAKGLDDAKATAERLHDEIAKNPASFAGVAKRESSDKATAVKGGDLGWVKAYDPQGNTQGSVLYQLYSNAKNTLGPVMLSAMPGDDGKPQAGYLFVKVDDVRDRTDSKTFNWEQDKAAALTRSKFRFLSEFGQNYIAVQQTIANIVRLSPELKYYAVMNDKDQQKVAAARDEFLASAADKVPGEVMAAVLYPLSNSEKDPAKRAAMREKVIEYGSTMEQQQIIFQLADDYVASNQKDKALEQLRNIAIGVSVSGDEYGIMHHKLKDQFTKLGATEDVKAMVDWLKKHPEAKLPAGVNPGMMMQPPGGGMPMTMPTR